MSKHLGFTGTRHGMTLFQLGSLENLFLALMSLAEYRTFHHGDCVGADVEAATIAARLGLRTVSHPPIKKARQANHESDEILPRKTFTTRNRDIVDICDFLIVCPREMNEVLRSGTWTTFRYARDVKKRPLTVLYPNE